MLSSSKWVTDRGRQSSRRLSKPRREEKSQRPVTGRGCRLCSQPGGKWADWGRKCLSVCGRSVGWEQRLKAKELDTGRLQAGEMSKETRIQNTICSSVVNVDIGRWWNTEPWLVREKQQAQNGVICPKTGNQDLTAVSTFKNSQSDMSWSHWGGRLCTMKTLLLLFTRAKTWKQPKCPSTDEWIKKM